LIFHLDQLVFKLQVNYPNWVMGTFNSDNGLFFAIIVLTTTYFIEHKLARKKQAKQSH